MTTDLCKDCFVRGDENLCQRHRLQGICPISDTWVFQAYAKEIADLVRDVERAESNAQDLDSDIEDLERDKRKHERRNNQ